MDINPGIDIEKSLSRSIDGLSSCGTGVAMLFLLLVLAVAMIVYLTKRNTETVNMVLRALVPGGDHGSDEKPT